MPSNPFTQLQTKLPTVLKQKAFSSQGWFSHSSISLHSPFSSRYPLGQPEILFLKSTSAVFNWRVCSKAPLLYLVFDKPGFWPGLYRKSLDWKTLLRRFSLWIKCSTNFWRNKATSNVDLLIEFCQRKETRNVLEQSDNNYFLISLLQGLACCTRVFLVNGHRKLHSQQSNRIKSVPSQSSSLKMHKNAQNAHAKISCWNFHQLANICNLHKQQSTLQQNVQGA